MTRRTRIVLVAAVAVAAAVGVAGGAALVGRDDEPEASRPKGVPPVLVDLGVRTDSEAQRLRHAARLHANGQRARALEAFSRGSSLQAEAGEAISAWPEGTLDRLEELGTLHPRSGAVLFHLGLARFWNADTNGAIEAWRAAAARDPDSAFAVSAKSSLPVFHGLPTFVPAFRPVAAVSPRHRSSAALRRRASGVDPQRRSLRRRAPADRPPCLAAQRVFRGRASGAPRPRRPRRRRDRSLRQAAPRTRVLAVRPVDQAVS